MFEERCIFGPKRMKNVRKINLILPFVTIALHTYFVCFFPPLRLEEKTWTPLERIFRESKIGVYCKVVVSSCLYIFVCFYCGLGLFTHYRLYCDVRRPTLSLWRGLIRIILGMATVCSNEAEKKSGK